MHRTNLYLTPEQERAVDARARAAGVSRSEVVRRIIDREIARGVPLDEDVAAAIASLSDQYGEVTAGLFDEDVDLRIER